MSYVKFTNKIFKCGLIYVYMFIKSCVNECWDIMCSMVIVIIIMLLLTMVMNARVKYV